MFLPLFCSVMLLTSSATCLSHIEGDQISHPAQVVRIDDATKPYQKPVPDYARWGRTAMEAARDKYPSAAIVDYLYVGRQSLDKTLSQDRFKFWMKEGPREFGVVVTVVFDNTNQRLVSTQLVETKR